MFGNEISEEAARSASSTGRLLDGRTWDEYPGVVVPMQRKASE